MKKNKEDKKRQKFVVFKINKFTWIITEKS